MKKEVSQGTDKFKCVQTKVFQINRSLTGLSTFVPIAFDREYTSMCLFTLHSSVIDFKFFAPTTNSRVTKRKKLYEANEEGEDEVQTFMENGILVERKYIDRERDFGVEKDKEERKSAKKWQAHNITEYLFFNEFGRLEISQESVMQTYQAYTNILKMAHNQLRKNYMDLA